MASVSILPFCWLSKMVQRPQNENKIISFGKYCWALADVFVLSASAVHTNTDDCLPSLWPANCARLGTSCFHELSYLSFCSRKGSGGRRGECQRDFRGNLETQKACEWGTIMNPEVWRTGRKIGHVGVSCKADKDWVIEELSLCFSRGPSVLMWPPAETKANVVTACSLSVYQYCVYFCWCLCKVLEFLLIYQ